MKFDFLAGKAHQPAAVLRDRLPRIAVFDSGLGGLTVHAEIARLLSADLIYVGDTAVFPYGRLPERELIERVSAVIGEVIERHVPDIVVIACNTASTLALPVLRAQFAIPFVGTVPAIKPAVAGSRSRLISVLATPGTVARDYTRELVSEHAKGCEVMLVGSARLASYAEAELNGAPADDADILAEIRDAFVEKGGQRTDTVVLACTHYPLIAARLEALAPWPVAWIDNAPAIARRVTSLAGDAAASMTTATGRGLFTNAAGITPALRAALKARGIDDIGVLTVPM